MQQRHSRAIFSSFPDVGVAYNASWFGNFFETAAAGGQNVARFWLHADGCAGLVYSSDKSVTGLTPSFTADLAALAKQAQDHKIVLQICLWSFDMCKKNEHPGDPHANLISDASATQSYLDKALVPMLKALSTFENIIIEVINEPEWCIREAPGNTDVQVSLVEMQRFVGMIAQTVHKHGKKVTVGSASLKWNSPAGPPAGSAVANYWSDAALKNATGGVSGAFLDHYQIHYYDWMFNAQWGYDPCRTNASVEYWQLDKPTIVGELPARSKHYNAAEERRRGGFQPARLCAAAR